MQVQKKSRNRELVYGINAVEQAIETSPEKILSAWIAKGREDDKRIYKLVQRLASYGVVTQVAMRHFLDEKCDGGVHQGIVLEMKATPPKNEHDLDELLESLQEKQEAPFLLVLDGGTGQNAVSQMRAFNEAVPVTGLALTKLDGTAKGGVVFTLADLFQVPIRYVGVGEKAEDLREFQVQPFIDALIDDKEL